MGPFDKPWCANPANGTHIVVRGNLRDTVLKSVLQRVIAWAEDDADKIEYHFGGGAPYVRIPPEVILAGHGDLTLKAGGPKVELVVDKGVWFEPTIFDVDGLNPTTLIEYDQKWENFAVKGKPEWDGFTVSWKYTGNSQQKTEPIGWILRWRKKVPQGSCPYVWDILDLPAWTRVQKFHGLDPETEYELSLQGIAQPGSTEVFTEAGEPITVKTATKPVPGAEPAPTPGGGGGGTPPKKTAAAPAK
jgi:hypothetical protein